MRPEALAPLGLVLPMMALALVAEPLAWSLLLGGAPLPVYVHALTLGCLAASLTGAGWQLVSVVTARPLDAPTRSLALAVNLALAPGLALLILGFSLPAAGLAGLALVVTGLALRSAAVLRELARAPGRRVVRLWILGAEASLLAGLAVGALRYADRLGLPAEAPALGPHVAWMLGGWVGGWIVGMSALLLPMFAVAREPRPLLALALPLWFGGLALQAPLVWAAGAWIAAGALAEVVLRGQRILGQVGFGLAGLALTAGLVAAGRWPEAVTAGLAVWAMPTLRGVAQRILPFLAWAHAFGHRPRGAPPIAALVPERLARASALLAVAGGAALLAGSGRAGPALLLAGSLLHLWTALTVGFRTWRGAMRAGAMPGMEAR